ncbi:hypothetical protein [Neobacillus piezotolerans]|uniref:hypothetical protein n=1 Tax=Neobacillus piezotolerans TaxID=2259171 RepID=UPI00115A3610|nr:hypothetical protein [Neobacillus piezotolerans]
MVLVIGVLFGLILMVGLGVMFVIRAASSEAKEEQCCGESNCGCNGQDSKKKSSGSCCRGL